MFALMMCLTLNGHDSTSLSSQKLSVAPLESSGEDDCLVFRHNTTFFLHHLVGEKFDFRGHECSKTAESVDLSSKQFPSD